MSLTSLLGKLGTVASLSTNPNAATSSDVQNVANNIQKLIDRTPKSFVFIQTVSTALSSNGSVGAVIVQSPVMGRGERGVVRDLNVNFSTVAGTVKICKINSSQLVLVDIVTGISATTSGTGNVVLEEGEAIAVVITTQAAGVLGVFFSGDKTQVGV